MISPAAASDSAPVSALYNSRPELDRYRPARMAVVAAVAAGVRIWLMIAFPIVFGGDSMVRLNHRDRVLMSHQLPLLQLCLYLLNLLSPALMPVRALMLAISVAAAEGFYVFARNFTEPRSAFLAALLFATSPFITAVSIVPYQEILMLAGLLFACHYYLNGRMPAASLCLGVACLSRHEAWTMCPAMALGYFQAGKTLRRAVIALFAFAWAPAAWIIWQHGLAPPGSYVIDHSITFRRFWRLAYIAAITVRQTPVPVLLLGCAGMFFVFRRGGWREPRMRLAGLSFGLFSIALLFSAHGDPPDPDRYITSRDAQIPITILILFSAAAIARYRRAGPLLATAGVLLGAAGAWRYVRHETSRPEVRLGYEAASYLNERAAPAENILIFAQPIPGTAIETYLAKARENGGEPAVEGARRLLASMDPLPLDVQRFRVHSRMRFDHVFAYPRVPSRADWVVAWNDFAPTEKDAAERLKSALERPEAVFHCQDKSVVISRSR